MVQPEREEPPLGRREHCKRSNQEMSGSRLTGSSGLIVEVMIINAGVSAAGGYFDMI